MQVVSIISTKGGVGKTTTAANLGGFVADAGLRVLLLDLDVQPTLSSYFTLTFRAPAGIYEMLTINERRAEQLVSRTVIAGLDLVLSNDDRGELNTLLLHAPDGRLRLRHLLPALAPSYDLVLIDTQGARSVLLEMAVLASSMALSPVTPEILAARELRRGTLQLIEDIAPYRHLGIEPPPLHLLINRVHPVSSNARLIQQALRQVFQGQAGVRVLDTDVPAIEAYLIASAYTVLVFLVRVLVLTLTLPLFLMAAFVGFVDGLVRRDVRSFGAGRESGFIYHRARAALMPLTVLPWVTYLALPVSVHPLLILLPSAALLGVAVCIAAATFKKYL